jgi:hypothetical protein
MKHCVGPYHIRQCGRINRKMARGGTKFQSRRSYETARLIDFELTGFRAFGGG